MYVLSSPPHRPGLSRTRDKALSQLHSSGDPTSPRKPCGVQITPHTVTWDLPQLWFHPALPPQSALSQDLRIRHPVPM